MADMHSSDLMDDRDNKVPGRNGPPNYMGALPTDKNYDPSLNTYRGWHISFSYGWCAVHPDFDASYEGDEDGWVGNGLSISNCQSKAALLDEIDEKQDEWTEANGQFGVGA